MCRLLLTFVRESTAGKFGRYRESLRGKAGGDDEEQHQHVSGN